MRQEKVMGTMVKDMIGNWQFTGDDGSFLLESPHRTNYLYFPLVNEAGMMSVVTPTLHGDTKIGQNAFLTLPVSVEDLHNTRSARNFWVYVRDLGAWSATGNSAPQVAQTFAEDPDETVTLEAGLLWHKVTRRNQRLGLCAEVLNFVPAGPDAVELMQVTLTNTGDRPLTITPTAAIPIFGRSADNLRDHRHVTSLLHRVSTMEHGVLARPTLSFDERGHRLNTVTYAVLGAEGDGAPPASFFPVVEDFIGEGGNLDWPEAVVSPARVGVPAGTTVDGYEAMGGLRFREVVLAPGESRSYVLILAIMVDGTGGEADRRTGRSIRQRSALRRLARPHARRTGRRRSPASASAARMHVSTAGCSGSRSSRPSAGCSAIRSSPTMTMAAAAAAGATCGRTAWHSW